MNEVHEHEIEKRDKAAEQEHRDDDDESRVAELLVFAESFFLRVPRPGSFLQLHFHFAKEVFYSRNHCRNVNSLKRYNVIKGEKLHSFLKCDRVTFQTRGSGQSRQEGLEPPTDGFGDRYSTN